MSTRARVTCPECGGDVVVGAFADEDGEVWIVTDDEDVP